MFVKRSRRFTEIISWNDTLKIDNETYNIHLNTRRCTNQWKKNSIFIILSINQIVSWRTFPQCKKIVVTKTASLHAYLCRVAATSDFTLNPTGFFEKSAIGKIIFQNAYLDKVLWLFIQLINSFDDNDAANFHIIFSKK